MCHCPDGLEQRHLASFTRYVVCSSASFSGANLTDSKRISDELIAEQWGDTIEGDAGGSAAPSAANTKQPPTLPVTSASTPTLNAHQTRSIGTDDADFNKLTDLNQM